MLIERVKKLLLKYFSRYIKLSRGVSDSTVRHYITGINTINTLLEKYEYPIKNIFDASSVDDLHMIKDFIRTNEEFITKDTVGNRMYSAAFNHFYRFACEDKQFYQNNIEKMDIIVDKPQMVNYTHTAWKRNQIIVDQVIENAKYNCEYNNDHNTFTAESTGKPFMEGHHLIPLKYQNKFNHGIDIYANIVCLCPICHRLIHFGIFKEKQYILDKLYSERKERMIHSGIDISRNDFIELIS